MQKDLLFSSPIVELGNWKFDEQVADVFPDMLIRSIPGYSIIVAMIGELAGRFAKRNSCIYDLGCSIGSVTTAMCSNINQPDCLIIAVDNSPAMIKRCKRHIAVSPTHGMLIDIQCIDICNVVIENASVVVLNFTLQFIAPSKRQALLNRIYTGLNPGGILILSEKIACSDYLVDKLLGSMYRDFKKKNGYSELEITQKENMLKNVMIIDTPCDHKQRLQKAGFVHIDSWFQYLNFFSLIAIK